MKPEIVFKDLKKFSLVDEAAAMNMNNRTYRLNELASMVTFACRQNIHVGFNLSKFEAMDYFNPEERWNLARNTRNRRFYSSKTKGDYEIEIRYAPGVTLSLIVRDQNVFSVLPSSVILQLMWYEFFEPAKFKETLKIVPYFCERSTPAVDSMAPATQ